MHWDKSKMAFVGEPGTLKRNPKTKTWVLTKANGESRDLGPNKDEALGAIAAAQSNPHGGDNAKNPGLLRWIASAMD